MRPILNSMHGLFVRWIVLLIFGLSSSCASVRYVAQAAVGEWELASAARPIPEVILDPNTPDLTRRLLSEVEHVRRFAQQNGLRVRGNYERFVQLDREYPVWFVNASHPLAFRARVFRFPIIGSFPGLSWFQKRDAEKFRDALAAAGWDVHMRGVTAFSTGGWFDDPIVSSMLSDAPGALATLVNTVLHESLHATIFVADQQYFNESLASFVGDTMTAQYLALRFGEPSPTELRAYLEGRRLGQERAQRLNAAYQSLERVYASDAPAREKYRRKAEIIDGLVKELRLRQRPNNATLIGFRLYHVGHDDFSELFEECDRDWRRFLSAASILKPSDFGQEQRADFGRVIDALRSKGCPTEPFPIDPFLHTQRRWYSQ